MEAKWCALCGRFEDHVITLETEGATYTHGQCVKCDVRMDEGRAKLQAAIERRKDA